TMLSTALLGTLAANRSVSGAVWPHASDGSTGGWRLDPGTPTSRAETWRAVMPAFEIANRTDALSPTVRVGSCRAAGETSSNGLNGLHGGDGLRERAQVGSVTLGKPPKITMRFDVGSSMAE